MAFPVIEGTPAETAVSTAGTSHAITLPASIAATDGVLIIMDTGTAANTFNALAGWQEILDENAANGLKIWWYTGAGVPSTPTFTSSGNIRSASIAFRISNVSRSNPPQIATTGTGTSATPDPPSVTPTGGVVRDYLLIAFAGMAGEEADDDTWANTPPTNYTPNPPWQKSCGIAGTNLGGLICAAARSLNTGSAQDPGTFGVDVSAAWRSQHVIVHPLAVGAATGAVDWVGSATGTSVHSGAATGAIAWAGAATGTSIHSGAATGAVDWVGSATGTRTPKGAATGAIAWAGAATGETPPEPPSQGSATGTITWGEPADVNVVTDDFNRADGALGPNWGAFSGVSTNQIVSNTVRVPLADTFYAQYWATHGFAADQFTEIDVQLGTDLSYVYLYVRSDVDLGGYYSFGWDTDAGGTYSLFGNTITGVGTSGTRRLRLEARGTTIRAYVDGALTFDIPDSNFTAGVVAFTAQFLTGGSSPTVDNFEAGSLGTATGTSPHGGSATGPITWAGSATGTRTSSGSATGAIDWVGTATGTAVHSGSASGAITWAGVATGESPAGGVNDGSATGAITWAGAATGTSAYRGSATGTITWVGAAIGARVSSGVAVGSITWAGVASGAPRGAPTRLRVFYVARERRVLSVPSTPTPTIRVERRVLIVPPAPTASVPAETRVLEVTQ